MLSDLRTLGKSSRDFFAGISTVSHGTRAASTLPLSAARGILGAKIEAIALLWTWQVFRKHSQIIRSCGQGGVQRFCLAADIDLLAAFW